MWPKPGRPLYSGNKMEKHMRTLDIEEIMVISGGNDCSGETSGSLQCPVPNPQSELGKSIDDVAGALNDFGSWLGDKIYDLTH